MIRKEAVLRISNKVPVTESEDLKSFDITKDYGADVFSDAVMRRCLPKSAYKAITKCIESGMHEIVDPTVADMVANAIKVWAVERGATHFTHWFQPMTGSTAEKHDAFISDTNPCGVGREVPMMAFSGSELVRGEPDASSFPNGGIRSTFEARGYTVWDPNSPPFIRRQQNGNFLCIPTAFCSWTGAALDKRTPLLRSDEALSKACIRMLRILGDHDSSLISSTLGAEQEFFLVDRDFYLARPDLVQCGRTLAGPLPARHQQLSDHYFGSIHPRVIALIQEVEKQVWRLGVPTRTRHNEVAPGQWEMAPVFEKSVLANDHNVVLMEILRETARKHGFECLLHEKPFAHINGSGKHNNWSMMNDAGENLLEPGKDPITNQRFMTFLAAILKAVDTYGDLLRWAVASASNDNRLGGHEAPPAIISVFLGSQLEQVVEDFVGYSDLGVSPRVAAPKYVKLGVSSLPPIPRDMTDRNRTSPFAFTGNKFEFRAVGSSQTCARAIMVINTIVADALHELCDAIDAKVKKGADKATALHATLVETFKQHKRIMFSGDGYSKEWREEAARRGLPILSSTPEAIEAFKAEKNIKLFDRLHVMSPLETMSRATIFLEAYCHSVGIEAKTLFNMAKVQLLPAGIKYQQLVAKSIADTKAAAPALDVSEQTKLLESVTTAVNALLHALAKLEADIASVLKLKDLKERAEFYRDHVKHSQEAVRNHVDHLEELVDDELWPIPKYSEMLFLR